MKRLDTIDTVLGALAIACALTMPIVILVARWLDTLDN